MGWEKKFPILKDYKDIIDIDDYTQRITDIIKEMMEKYNFSTQDAFLVIKDIMYQEYSRMKKEEELKKKLEKIKK